MTLASRQFLENEIERWLRDWSVTAEDWTPLADEMVHMCAIHFQRRLSADGAGRALVKRAFEAGLRVNVVGGIIADGHRYDKAIIGLMQSALKFAGFKIDPHGTGSTSSMLQAITRLFKKGEASESAESVLRRTLVDVGKGYADNSHNAFTAAVEMVVQAEQHLSWALLGSDSVQRLIEQRAKSLGIVIKEQQGREQPLLVGLNIWMRRSLEQSGVGVKLGGRQGISEKYAF